MSVPPASDVLITFDYKLSILLTMALVIQSVTQLTPVRDCIRFLFYCHVLFVLYIFQSVYTGHKDGKNNGMESVQRYHCCELALGLHGVRRRAGAISDREPSSGEVEDKRFRAVLTLDQLHRKFVEELGWIDEVMVSRLWFDVSAATKSSQSSSKFLASARLYQAQRVSRCFFALIRYTAAIWLGFWLFFYSGNYLRIYRMLGLPRCGTGILTICAVYQAPLECMLYQLGFSEWAAHFLLPSSHYCPASTQPP